MADEAMLQSLCPGLERDYYYFASWKNLCLGMSDCLVREVEGSPQNINRTTTQFGTSEQWIYPKEYLYFEKGVLTGWQD